MKSSTQSLAASLIVIALGAAWLLNTMDVIPNVNWVWTIGLALSGLLVMGIGGINKLTIVTGPLLIIASVLSILRQTGRLDLNREVPILVIVLGLLMLISQISPAPPPGWIQPPRK